MKKTYSEKLQDPRWQKKRLEILSRDNFTCNTCSNTKKTLHVHHKNYLHGHQPWEYDNDNFNTLCKDCHSLIEFIKKHLVVKYEVILITSKKGTNNLRLFYIYAKELTSNVRKVHFVEEIEGDKPYKYWMSLTEKTVPDIQKAFKKISSRTQVS